MKELNKIALIVTDKQELKHTIIIITYSVGECIKVIVNLNGENIEDFLICDENYFQVEEIIKKYTSIKIEKIENDAIDLKLINFIKFYN